MLLPLLGLERAGEISILVRGVYGVPIRGTSDKWTPSCPRSTQYSTPEDASRRRPRTPKPARELPGARTWFYVHDTSTHRSSIAMGLSSVCLSLTTSCCRGRFAEAQRAAGADAVGLSTTPQPGGCASCVRNGNATSKVRRRRHSKARGRAGRPAGRPQAHRKCGDDEIDPAALMLAAPSNPSISAEHVAGSSTCTHCASQLLGCGS
jgi:hypothetical protein